MSHWNPDLVYPGKSVYHAVYGSHDGGFDPQEQRWQYWVLCDGGPKSGGWPKWIPRRGLDTLQEAESRGLKPCKRACSGSLERLAKKGSE